MKYNYEVSVNENRAKLNKDIFLFRGNRNIHYYFSIKGARFAFEKEGDLIENANAIYAAVTVIKPNGVEVANAIAPVENGLIHLKVTEDLIDEEVEIGDFDLVFDLFDDNEGAVTIPKIKGQFHVQERPCITSIGTLSGNVNVVNQAVVDLAIATQENEQLIVVDADGKYVKTTWVKGDKISIERLNKIEEGIEKNSTQYKDIAKQIEGIKSSSLINQNGGGELKIWAGTKVEYDTLLVKDENTIYIIVEEITTKTFTIVNNLSNATNCNSSTSISQNSSYDATITANTGYILGEITVTMGGENITNSSVSGNIISIENVTGDIIINCVATEEIVQHNSYYIQNFTDKCYINKSTGELVSNPKGTVSEFINVTPSTQLTISNDFTTDLGTIRIGEYNKDKNFIIRNEYNENYTLSSTTQFIRIYLDFFAIVKYFTKVYNPYFNETNKINPNSNLNNYGKDYLVGFFNSDKTITIPLDDKFYSKDLLAIDSNSTYTLTINGTYLKLLLYKNDEATELQVSNTGTITFDTKANTHIRFQCTTTNPDDAFSNYVLTKA